MSKPTVDGLKRWYKATGVMVIVGAITVGAPGTIYAATPAVDRGLHESVTLTAPSLGQSAEAANSKYLSTHVDRDRSSGSPSVLPGQMTAAATRCPAFVTWEDWGGSRVHAYVDFHPSDLCNG